ncbi:MAG: ferric reductase-like transmembrane domain-containing protein [Rhodobacterales bacterium]|nr:ferric reductase-like transmembrane domain-containing protein [Rhodobacterales bacterium]MDX5391072.1 ferric reductase-like transmembrane domain-containing protein [Rhodobacterales bacterium]MDX5490767.1 ferric reductase-like transmembrane domain-containing protein [Rhodobacterales bacterium]
MPATRSLLIWAALVLVIAVPLAIAATSPLLAWRQPVYILAGFAGVIGMALILLQPLLAGGYLPGLTARRGRAVHRWTGAALVVTVIVHVVGLWITSPPDVIDALLFASPTPFSVWGVIAMWAIFATALLALLRARRALGPRAWRLGHSALAFVIAAGTALHALLIEGTMGQVSKIILAILVMAATLKALSDLRAWVLLRRRRS